MNGYENTRILQQFVQHHNLMNSVSIFQHVDPPVSGNLCHSGMFPFRLPTWQPQGPRVGTRLCF